VSKNSKNINIAVLYAEANSDYWSEMERHLNLLVRRHQNVRVWTVRDAELGSVVKQEIREELSQADITLLLLSADFAIENVFDEETRILLANYARHAGQGRYVVPVIVQDFLWRDYFDDTYDLEKLKFFDRIVQNPENREAVYKEITRELSRYIDEINARSLNCVIPTWVGFLGGIMYNNGFIANQKTTLYQKFKRTLRFQLNDSVDATCKQLQAGEANLIWATMDRLPSVLHKLRDRQPRVIAQVSWSNGADAIIARNGIKSVAELKGKKIIYPYDSPAFTLLKYILREAGMDTFDVEHLMQKNVDLDIISKTFIHDTTIDAIVLWSPYVEACLAEATDAQVIAHTGDYPGLIADVMIATEEFIRVNKEELVTFFAGWFDEIERFNADDLYKIGSLGVLVEAIIRPLPTIIPTQIKRDLMDALRGYFQSSLEKVHLTSLADNESFFGLDSDATDSPAALLYRQFMEFQFPEYLTDPDMQWDRVVDTAVLREVRTAME
jgi:hypothetical protein